MTKVCPRCGQEKFIDEFHKNKRRKDGRQSYCKACRSEYKKRKYREMSPRVIIATTKTCSKCGKEKHIDEFHRHKGSKDGRYWWCKACRSEYNSEYSKRKYREMSPLERSIHNMACGVTKRTGLNGVYTKKGIKNLLGNKAEIKRFLLENFSEDIQAILDKGETPSIDRIDSKGHYEPGNVRVISWSLNSKLGALGKRNEREEKQKP